MQYRVKFSTYDKELADILDRLGAKRSKFIEIAVGNFIHTGKGRETLETLCIGNEKADKSPVFKNPHTVFLKPGKTTKRTGKNPQCGLMEKPIEKQITEDIEKETYAETEAEVDNMIDLDKFL